VPDVFTSWAVGRSSVQASLWATGLFFMALLAIFQETTSSIIAIWSRSDTFAHGFVILPISLWLVWSQRARLQGLNPVPAPWVALLMIAPGFVWLMAWLVDVMVVQQLALVAMLIVGAWAILGNQLARTLAFPLFFLFFAVPMGEALVPPMMEFTATSTVWMIQQTGIPVYREGLYFTLPSGKWSVVEACSGVRYIIASVTLGVLYAYLTYRSLWRRVFFVLVSAIVPVFANTARAYIIVMLGHMSGMKLATGVDHLVYGWVFFALVIFVLFWLGSFFREDSGTPSVDSLSDTTGPGAGRINVLRLLISVVAVLLTSAVWPLLAHTTQSRVGADTRVVVTLPEASGAWRALPEASWHWQPESSVAGHVASYYHLHGQALGLFVQYPDGAREQGEVVGSSTRFIGRESELRVVNRAKVTLQLGDRAFLADRAELLGTDGRLLAWSWYRIGGVDTSNDYLAKFRESLASLGFGTSGSYRVVVALPLQTTVISTQELLNDFLDAHGHLMGKALNRALEDD
jgi:exosortase A